MKNFYLLLLITLQAQFIFAQVKINFHNPTAIDQSGKFSKKYLERSIVITDLGSSPIIKSKIPEKTSSFRGNYGNKSWEHRWDGRGDTEQLKKQLE